MAQAACPKCKKMIDLEAAICPYCRTNFTNKEMESRKEADNNNKKSLGIGCLVMIGLAGLLVMCSGDDAPKEPEPKNSKEAAIRFYKKIQSEVYNCDVASKTMASTIATDDVVSAYKAANQARSVCLGVSGKIDNIEIYSGFDEKRQKDAVKVKQSCSMAYTSKWAGAKALSEVLDGDVTPSAVAELQDQTSGMESETLLCSVQLVAFPMSYGATLKELGVEDKE